MSSSSSASDYRLVEKNEMENFMERCMLAVGTSENHAKSLASCLIAADYQGNFSHGLNRLEIYIRDVKSKTTDPDGEPKIIKEAPAIAIVDGNNVLGPVVGNFCMKLAIEKAKKTGMAMVNARRSNHYGIAGHYAMQAVRENLIGLSFTNTSPLVFATRSSKKLLGTNPIAFGAPGKNGDYFLLDMATSTVAYGKVEMNHRKNMSIPNSWGADSTGRVTTDPSKVLNEGGLLPLGGSEETGGYKGYGLAIMVEILCGILSNASYGPFIRHWKSTSEEANLGQCFIVIDPQFADEGFQERLQHLMDVLRSSEAFDADKPVLIPGDPERMIQKKADEDNGITYHVNQIIYAENIAKELNIQPPKYKLLQN